MLGDIFRPLDLPDASPLRTAAGTPGEAYWQQRADYVIRATLDPAEHRISGSETITYTNNSPESLALLWLQLDQNIFHPESRGATIQGGDSRWSGAFPGGGFTLGDLVVVQNGRRYTPEHLVDDTRLRLSLEEPVPAGGGTVQIEIAFSFVVPPYGADRNGRLDVEQGTVYEIAQWYPRMYVFDDVHGWNALPYLGQGEFYLEYGNFDLEITAPREFVVVATGALTNPEEVLTAEQQQRLAAARSSAETVTIIGKDEVGRPASRPAASGPLTWRFRAENVRDVSWAASDAFLWDAASWEDVLVQSFYPHEGLGTPNNPGWEKSTEYVRHSIAHYSEQWFRYPYPVATNVGGVVGGMEYPMIVFCDVRARGFDLFDVTDHEIGHSWFPMIVGSDERRYAWMDEGFDTFINYYSTLAYYGADGLPSNSLDSDYIARLMRSRYAVDPINTYPDRIDRYATGFLSYRKPGKGLLILREYILGPERFDPAFRAYIEEWAYKHPQPSDFFRLMESTAGEDLDWFWRAWFYESGTLDQAVASVVERDDATLITVTQPHDFVLPVELQVTYAGGRTERKRIPVEAFATRDAFTEAVVGDVVRVEVDPDFHLPDVDRTNNEWTRSGAGTVGTGTLDR